MIPLSIEDKIDSQRQLRAKSLGLGPCIRFSKDAREVLIGRSPVSKNKAHRRFITRKMPNQKTVATISNSVSHPQRAKKTYQNPKIVIHQRSRDQVCKKRRVKLCRRMSSFGSLRRRITSFSFPGVISRVISTDTNNSASLESSEVASEKSSRRRSIGLSHISSRLRNKLRRDHKPFQSVITMDKSITSDEVSYHLAKNQEYSKSYLNQQKTAIESNSTNSFSENLSTFFAFQPKEKERVINNLISKKIQDKDMLYDGLRAECPKEFYTKDDYTCYHSLQNPNWCITV